MSPFRFKSLLLLFVGFAGGFGLAWLLFSPGPGEATLPRTEDDGPTTFSGSGRESGFDSGLAIEDSSLSFRQLRRIAEARAVQAPIAAMEAASDVPGYDNREAYIASVLQAWGEADGPAAAEYCLANFDGERMADNLYYVAEGWAESDPPAAAEWFLGNTEASAREDALWEVLESWGRKDAESAFDWVGPLDEDIKAEVIDGLAQGWASVDPEGAARIGEALHGETYQYEFLTSVASHWTDRDPSAAAEWASGLLSEENRSGVFEAIGENWASFAPTDAAELAVRLEDSANRRAMLSGVASAWSEHDPVAAMDFISGLETDEEHMSEMLGEVIYHWSSVDPSGTVDWLEEREAGLNKDNVLSVFSDVIVNMDTEAAVAWANQISDPNRRMEKLRSLSALWIRKEGDFAVRRLSEMDLPAGFSEEILDK